MRIARDDDAVLRQENERERAFELQQRFAQRAGQRALAGVRHQVQNHFGVAGWPGRSSPRFSSSRRSSAALVMLPLCATAICPLLQITENGWALSSTVSPAVE